MYSFVKTTFQSLTWADPDCVTSSMHLRYASTNMSSRKRSQLAPSWTCFPPLGKGSISVGIAASSPYLTSPCPYCRYSSSHTVLEVLESSMANCYYPSFMRVGLAPIPPPHTTSSRLPLRRTLTSDPHLFPSPCDPSQGLVSCFHWFARSPSSRPRPTAPSRA